MGAAPSRGRCSVPAGKYVRTPEMRKRMRDALVGIPRPTMSIKMKGNTNGHGNLGKGTTGKKYPGSRPNHTLLNLQKGHKATLLKLVKKLLDLI